MSREAVVQPAGASGKHQAAATLKGLRGRVVESLIALGASTLLGQGANTIAQLILAGILAPAEFGAISVSTLIMTAFVVMRNAFVIQTLIHRQDRVRESADQMVILSTGLGLVLCITIWLVSSSVAQFFHAPQSELLLRLVAIGFLIDSIGTVPDTLFEKELRFRRKMWLESAKPLIVAVLSVFLASRGVGPASVGWGQIAGYSFWTIGLYILTDYRPRPRLNGKLMREMLNYGRYVLAGSILVFFFTNLDNASIGRLLGAKELGYYAFSFTLSYFPANVVTMGVVASVVLPVFAKLQGQREAQGKAFVSTLRYVSYYAAPMCIVIIMVGPAALHAVYGHKWEPSYFVLQTLAVYGLFHSYFLVVRNLCNGTGRARWFSRISGLQLVLVLPLLIPAPLTLGINGTALLFTAGKVIATAVALGYALHFTAVHPKRLIRPLGLPMVVALGAGAVALLALRITSLVWTGKNPIGVILALAAFSVVYVVVILVADRSLIAEGMALVKSGKKGLTGKGAAGPITEPTLPVPALEAAALATIADDMADIALEDTMVLWRADLWGAYRQAVLTQKSAQNGQNGARLSQGPASRTTGRPLTRPLPQAATIEQEDEDGPEYLTPTMILPAQPARRAPDRNGR